MVYALQSLNQYVRGIIFEPERSTISEASSEHEVLCFEIELILLDAVDCDDPL
jgi:hypothetical protein